MLCQLHPLTAGRFAVIRIVFDNKTRGNGILYSRKFHSKLLLSLSLSLTLSLSLLYVQH
jgi:hypothetical protein